jgi:hypothetical protein
MMLSVVRIIVPAVGAESLIIAVVAAMLFVRKWKSGR